MLALEIELLTGTYRAELPDHSRAEWPPHPERVLSALVQSWADGGCNAGERAALEWLESLPAPLIEADDVGDAIERAAPTVFVPPNDQRGSEIAVLPDRRPRQARSFRVRAPSNPIVRLIWPDVSADRHKSALDAMARGVASLGHSASLARFAFTNEVTPDDSKLWRPDENGNATVRMFHPGRLQNLERWLANGERPLVGVWCAYRGPSGELPIVFPTSVFGGEPDWFVFEDVGGNRPDLLAFAHVAKCVRMSLLKYATQPPPEMISGHNPDGTPTSKPHLAVVPLANLGWPHATGDLLGFAVLLPRIPDAEGRRSVVGAIARWARIEQGDGAYAELRLASNLIWKLQRSVAPSRASLRPSRWCTASASWASATPVLLDRFADRNDPVEEAECIAGACRNIGLPEPIEIEIHKHSTVRGSPSAYSSRAARSPVTWSFPEGAKFAHRPRRHVVLRFAIPVEGPIIIGAGRYHGFGLCLPLNQER